MVEVVHNLYFYFSIGQGKPGERGKNGRPVWYYLIIHSWILYEATDLKVFFIDKMILLLRDENILRMTWEKYVPLFYEVC